MSSQILNNPRLRCFEFKQRLLVLLLSEFLVHLLPLALRLHPFVVQLLLVVRGDLGQTLLGVLDRRLQALRRGQLRMQVLLPLDAFPAFVQGQQPAGIAFPLQLIPGRFLFLESR